MKQWISLFTLLAAVTLLPTTAKAMPAGDADQEVVITLVCGDDPGSGGLDDVEDTVAARIWSMEYGTAYKVKDSGVGPVPSTVHTRWFYNLYYKINQSGSGWPYSWTFEGEHDIPPADGEGVCQKIVVLIQGLDPDDEVRFWAERYPDTLAAM